VGEGGGVGGGELFGVSAVAAGIGGNVALPAAFSKTPNREPAAILRPLPRVMVSVDFSAAVIPGTGRASCGKGWMIS